MITGKPVGLGGSLGREEATGRGAFLVIQEYARVQKLLPERTRVAIQGFGNAGYHVARLLQKVGYRIVAISDSKGAIYSEDGFDVESLYQQKQRTRRLDAVYCDGSVCNAVPHERIENDALLELDVDMLIPAALGGVIGPHNADRIRAPLVVEVANGPVAGSVDAKLQAQGTVVLPDVLVNAGGVTVSYFEWVQNRQGWAWTLERVRERLAEMMTSAFRRVWDVYERESLAPRSAAYAVALRRLEQAIAAHGTRDYFAGNEGG